MLPKQTSTPTPFLIQFLQPTEKGDRLHNQKKKKKDKKPPKYFSPPQKLKQTYNQIKNKTNKTN